MLPDVALSCAYVYIDSSIVNHPLVWNKFLTLTPTASQNIDINYLTTTLGDVRSCLSHLLLLNGTTAYTLFETDGACDNVAFSFAVPNLRIVV